MVNVAAFHVIIRDKGAVQYMLCTSPVKEINGFGTSAKPDFANLSSILAEERCAPN
jgi:hypothetical protein